MNYFTEFEFKIPKQERSKKTIDDIERAIEILAKKITNLKDITTRDISERSGYALGTLYHHFNNQEDLFVYLFLIRRQRAYQDVIEVMKKHPSDQPLSVLVAGVIDCFMEQLSRPNRKHLLFTMRQLLKRSKNPELINKQADVLIPYWMDANKRDKTNTILKYSEKELGLRFRAIQTIIRSPFFESDEMAGSSEHREEAINLAIQLLSTPPPSIK